MFYRVIKDFTDLQDDNHIYFAGDTFPREGVDVDNARLMELSSDANKRGEALLEVVDDPETDVEPEAEPEAEIQPEADENEAIEETVGEVEKAPKKGNKSKKEK